MAEISYPQLVHNIKEKYIEATGAADNIKFGEIAQDVYDAITSGGGGVEITDITLNQDGTYTITDADSNTHTLTVTETNGQITAITYDGDAIPLTFDASGNLTSVGEIDIDISSMVDVREWIKSSGAYIDTDIITDIDDRYEIEFDVISSSSRFDVFCYNGNRASEDGAGIYIFKDNGNNFDAYIGGQFKYSSMTWTAGSYKITIANKTISLYRNGALVNTATSTGTTQSTYTWRLLNAWDSALTRYCTFNVKSYKIYDKVTDELKHSIVPAYKDINNIMTGGVIDLITNKFYQVSDGNFEISST